jgi:hypothetical protein
LLDFLEKTISYIYRWNTAKPIDEDAELEAKNAANRTFVMINSLTKVTEVLDGHQVGTLSLTELRKNMIREQQTTSSSKLFSFTIHYNTVALQHSVA